jgi:hypothetical protein
MAHKGRKKVFNMSATGIVLAIVAWLALQIPLGMVVGHCIRRTCAVAATRAHPKARHPFVAQPHAALRG